MSDIPALALALLPAPCSARFSSAAFGGRSRRALRPRAPALWFLGSLLLRTGADSGRILFCFAGSLVEARGVPPWISDRARRRREAAQHERRRKSRLHWKRRPAMRLSPDELVFWRYGFVVLNSTIVTTWALMLVMTVGAKLITRKLETEGDISRWQGFLEIVVTTIQKQIKEVGLQHPEKYLGFIGTLFLFIAVSNLCAILPWVRTTDRFALDNVGAGDLRVCRRAALRHRGARVGRLPQVLPEAHVHHAAV